MHRSHLCVFYFSATSFIYSSHKLHKVHTTSRHIVIAVSHASMPDISTSVYIEEIHQSTANYVGPFLVVRRPLLPWAHTCETKGKQRLAWNLPHFHGAEHQVLADMIVNAQSKHCTHQLKMVKPQVRPFKSTGNTSRLPCKFVTAENLIYFYLF